MSIDNEQHILFELCVIAGCVEDFGKDNKMKKKHGQISLTKSETCNLVTFIIEHIAKTLHYESAKSLLNDHMSFLFGKWCESKLPLNQFPIHLLEESNFKEFLERHVEVLLPKLAYLKDSDTMQFIAQILERPLNELVVEYFSLIFAQSFPLFYCKGKKEIGTQICESFLPELLKPANVNMLIPKQLDSILINLLELIRYKYKRNEDIDSQEDEEEEEEGDEDEETEEDQFGFYLATTIRMVVTHLAGGFKLDTVELLFKTKDRVQKILLHINEALARSHRKQVFT